MAAMRSVLASLGRRCGSSAGSSMAGRGLDKIHQVLPPLPSQSLGPSATRPHRGLRRYSSECDRPFDMRVQRPRGAFGADHCLLALALFVPLGYVVTVFWRRKLLPFSGPRTHVPDVDYDNYEDDD